MNDAAVARAVRRRILRSRLAVVEAKRDRIAAKLRALKERDGRKMDRAIRESLEAGDRAARTSW